MAFFYINTELPRTGATEHFPGAGVVWDTRPSHQILDSRKQSYHQNVLQSQSAVCQSHRTSLLCASPSVPHCCVPFIPLEQLCVLTASGGSLTWKCSTPSALASPQTIAGLFRGPGDATMLMLRSLPCN